MNIFLHPAHFRNMDKAFNAVIQLNKCTIIGNIGDAAGYFAVQLKFRSSFIPRIGLKLFHAQADALGFGVDFNHLHTHGFTNSQNL